MTLGLMAFCESGCTLSAPVMSLSSVVLPEPLAPTMQMRDSRSMPKLRPSKIHGLRP